MLFCQISDLHVVPNSSDAGKLMRTETFMKGAIKHLLQQSPPIDAVLVSGDLVETGSIVEYELLVTLLDQMDIPTFVAVGNHDHRAHCMEVLTRRGHDYLPTEGFIQYCVELGPLRLIVLDTSIPGQPSGLLCQERLQWLDSRLGESNKPTLIMQHHPPFRTGITKMDEMGLSGAAEESEIIASYAHVQRVLCGHLHRSIQTYFAGTIASTAPSIAHAIELSLFESGRLALNKEPPACVFHAWIDNQLVSHTSYIGDFGAPFVIEK